jgi:2,4-dienoyl-CoA reductase-like NADH-dependent reductase (Old Yellow Enzyme family)
MINMKYPLLFSPIFIGDMQVKKRIIMPAMDTHSATITGNVTGSQRLSAKTLLRRFWEIQ